jgi:hypothetical protein
MKVDGRKRIVTRAIVFMAALSRLLLTAIAALNSATERLILLSSWVIRLNIYARFVSNASTP